MLGDGVEFLLVVVFAERVSTEPRSPAPASTPAQLLCVLLLRGQQEHHAAGHQDVPQRVGVVVVVLSLGENVQANSDEGTERSGDQEEDPALPGGRVAVSATDPPVHLSTPWGFSFTASMFRPSRTQHADAYPCDNHEHYGTEDGAQQVPQTPPVQLHGHGYEQSSEHEQSLQHEEERHDQTGTPDKGGQDRRQVSLTYLTVCVTRAMHRMVTQMAQTEPRKSQYCRAS